MTAAPPKPPAPDGHQHGAGPASAEAWRAALRRCPEDWQAALALKAELSAMGQYAEGDPAFRQARRHFPDAAWVAHVAALYAFPQGELPALTARARSLATARPDDPALHDLLGRMLEQGRDYAGAAAAYANDKRPEARIREAGALRARTLERWLAEAPSFGPSPAIAMINLERNTARMAELDRQFAGCAPPCFRVSGVEASRLPAPAIARLGGDGAMRGTLGCFLGHAAAWEAMLARGLKHCLVVEDDVIPLFDLPARWGLFGLPESFDICFVNDRLSPPGATAFGVHTLGAAMRQFPAWRNAPGADGYLLSAAGARTLLDHVERDGFGGDVDWRLIAYGTTRAECAALPSGSHAFGALAALPHGTSAGPLAAYVLSPPLIRTVPLASDREDENRAGGQVPLRHRPL